MYIYNTSRKTIPISPLDVHCFLFSEITLVLLMFCFNDVFVLYTSIFVVRYQNTPNATFKSTSNYIIYILTNIILKVFFSTVNQAGENSLFSQYISFPSSCMTESGLRPEMSG